MFFFWRKYSTWVVVGGYFGVLFSLCGLSLLLQTRFVGVLGSFGFGDHFGACSKKLLCSRHGYVLVQVLGQQHSLSYAILKARAKWGSNKTRQNHRKPPPCTNHEAFLI